MLVMIYAVFLTGSRGGFISLLVAAAVCLWQFAIRGRRRFLLLLAGLVGVVLWQSSSKMLSERLIGTVDPQENVASAYGSAQQREELFWRSVEVTEEHPLVGVGPGNFQGISGSWQVTHNSYTEMSSEGGIPALVLYVLILWYGFKNVAATKRLVPKQRELALLAYALHASLAGFIAGALFGSEGYEFFPFFLVAYTTALNWIARRSASRYETDKRGHEATPENELHANTIEHQMSRPSC
jgi:O-antigen ligase